MDQLATKADCSRQFIVRAEQGVYVDAPLQLLEVLSDFVDTGVDYDVFNEQKYRPWQGYRRQESFGSLSTSHNFHVHDVDLKADPKLLTAHPFVHWRLHSGMQARIEVSKLFCVHPALIFKFEVTPWRCVTIPSELLAALSDSGYNADLLMDFVDAYKAYRERRLKALA